MRSPAWGDVAKRATDIALSGGLLIVLSPLMIAIAIGVRATSPGPALFSQPREGRNGVLFEMLKFRTMHACDSDREASRLTVRGDPRITPLGRFLRRSSLDELPQLVNVLRGEMSMVGPRPHPPRFRYGTLVFEEVLPRYAERTRVRPGITGLAQVKGLRGTPDAETEALAMIGERVENDLVYVETRSLLMDLTILARTAVGAWWSSAY